MLEVSQPSRRREQLQKSPPISLKAEKAPRLVSTSGCSDPRLDQGFPTESQALWVPSPRARLTHGGTPRRRSRQWTGSIASGRRPGSSQDGRGIRLSTAYVPKKTNKKTCRSKCRKKFAARTCSPLLYRTRCWMECVMRGKVVFSIKPNVWGPAIPSPLATVRHD